MDIRLDRLRFVSSPAQVGLAATGLSLLNANKYFRLSNSYELLRSKGFMWLAKLSTAVSRILLVYIFVLPEACASSWVPGRFWFYGGTGPYFISTNGATIEEAKAREKQHYLNSGFIVENGATNNITGEFYPDWITVSYWNYWHTGPGKAFGSFGPELSDCEDSAESYCRPPLPSELYVKYIGRPYCSVGNPIAITTGNKYQQETDLLNTSPFLLTLQRSYNSSDGRWRFNYKRHIAFDGADTASVVRSDGKTYSYVRSAGVWSSDADVFHQLDSSVDGYDWRLTLAAGDIEYYDNQGRLLLLQDRLGRQQSLSYGPDTITIDNGLGEQLVIMQNADGLPLSATLNGTDSVTYGYDSWDRLVSVTRSDGTSRQYHYENTNFPYHLTGITDERGIRFATWAYDTEGRGILSEHAGQERAELVFNADGSTTVTNALGKQTTYHFTEIEGLKRVTRVEGHASANCLAANKNYTYYPNGLLETKTDWQGNVTRFEYNDRGLITRRVEAQGTPAEKVTDWTWDATRPLPLTRTKGGSTVHFEYDASGQLVSQQFGNN